MSELFCLSAYETSAREFFEALDAHHADLVLDVRLRNTSQLCGFTKQRDLAYLVERISGARYACDPAFAPTGEMLDAYLKHRHSWEEYAEEYHELMERRGAREMFEQTYAPYAHICLLGTATRKRRSHNEVLRDLLAQGSRA